MLKSSLWATVIRAMSGGLVVMKGIKLKRVFPRLEPYKIPSTASLMDRKDRVMENIIVRLSEGCILDKKMTRPVLVFHEGIAVVENLKQERGKSVYRIFKIRT